MRGTLLLLLLSVFYMLVDYLKRRCWQTAVNHEKHNPTSWKDSNTIGRGNVKWRMAPYSL